MADVEAIQQESIGVLVRRLEQDYISGQTTSSKYVTTSLSEDVNKVYAYLESKHTTGETDSLGRDKPFFNIVLAARNIWFRATDIDRKDIKIKAKKSRDVLISFIATSMLQDWMRRENFGAFLNDWGINSAGFNETVLKFVEQGGELIPSVVPWSRIMCDSINFKDNPKIEVLELTEAQLYKKGYDSDQVESLCEALKARETLDKRKKDNKSTYIKLYEVHGEFSQATYKKSKGIEPKEGDDDIYFQQMHVISSVEGKKKGEYEDFTLYSGKEKDPYMLTALLPEVDGSISLRGAVKCLFDSQWMQNHTVKAIKDMLDLASKLIFQTNDGTFVGQNALSSIENGDILIHADGKPLTQINNGSHDTASLQNFGTMWKSLGNEIVGISESMLGINPPSGTAWRQTEALLGESHSLFELMTENKGLAIEQMLRQFVIPFFKKKLKHSKEIGALLDGYGIDKIDALYVKKEAVKRMINKDITAILNGQQPTQDLAGATQDVQGELSTLGGQRFFKPSEIKDTTWEEIFKDLEWDPEVDVTGESTNKDVVTTLNTLLMTIAKNPGILQDENMKKIISKIMEATGAMSPLEISEVKTSTPSPTSQIPAPQTVT